MNGPVISQIVNPADVSAPAAGTFGPWTQTGNGSATQNVTCPLTDVDGPLSGLAKVTLAVLPAADGVDPFVGLNADGVLALNPATFELGLTPADAGASKDIPHTFNSGATPLALAVFFSD